MTVNPSPHPADDRLAALADDEPDARHDSALTEHVESCRQCTAVVEDLRALQSALAELPDLVPSRPLRLLPPAAPLDQPRTRWVGTLRRLAAPALAIGVLLMAVGALGTLSSLGLGASAGAAPASSQQYLSEDAGRPSAAASGSPSTARQVPGVLGSSATSPPAEPAFGPGARTPTPSPNDQKNASASPTPAGLGGERAVEPPLAGVSLYPLILLLGAALTVAGALVMILGRRRGARSA
jgi:hypothetical protein